MNVSLPPQFEAMIRRKVESGQFRDASDVVGEALRQMESRERRLAELRDALAVAEEQVAQGRVVEWTPELRAEILQRAREAAAAGKQPKADVCP